MIFYFFNKLFSCFTQPKTMTPTRHAHFEIFTDQASEYRFRLIAPNGEIILASEGYTTKASAKKGIASVKRYAIRDEYYDRKTTKNGLARFNLKAANHEIIGTSESYVSVTGRDRGIASVKRNAPNATVVDLT